MTVDNLEANEAYYRGIAAMAKNNVSLAFDSFAEASNLAPGVPAYRLQLALACSRLARMKNWYLDIALWNAREACRMHPTEVGHWIVLGEISIDAGQMGDAIAAYEKALTLKPDMAFAWGLLGYAYIRNGEFDQGRIACEKAVAIDPELGTPHMLLSGLYYQKFFNPEKIAHHGEMGFSTKQPAVLGIESMWNGAHGFLMIGQYKKGWAYFEARLRPNSTNSGQLMPQHRYPNRPLWRGEPVKRLLIQHEMGFGDSFCMVRYLPMIKKKFNCEIIYECHPAMQDLLTANFPDVTFKRWGTVKEDEFDVQIPILSLPLVMLTQSYTVPWFGPYITAQVDKTIEWTDKLQAQKHALTVGVCWFSGRNSHSADNHHTSKRKSLTFEQIKPLLDMPGVNFISLQNERDEQFKNPGIKDFSDTAAIISLCDIVISVDTAVANLAGAMGKELWLLDRHDYDWRWSPHIKTPWFPTADIYRQAEDRQWQPVVKRIMRDLAAVRDRIAA